MGSRGRRPESNAPWSRPPPCVSLCGRRLLGLDGKSPSTCSLLCPTALFLVSLLATQNRWLRLLTHWRSRIGRSVVARRVIVATGNAALCFPHVSFFLVLCRRLRRTAYKEYLSCPSPSPTRRGRLSCVPRSLVVLTDVVLSRAITASSAMLLSRACSVSLSLLLTSNG